MDTTYGYTTPPTPGKKRKLSIYTLRKGKRKNWKRKKENRRE